MQGLSQQQVCLHVAAWYAYFPNKPGKNEGQTFRLLLKYKNPKSLKVGYWGIGGSGCVGQRGVGLRLAEAKGYRVQGLGV